MMDSQRPIHAIGRITFLVLACSPVLRSADEIAVSRDRFPRPRPYQIQSLTDLCTRRGWKTDTFEQLTQAIEKADGYTPFAAMRLMAYRFDEKAKPELKRMLDHPKWLRRYTAAELLATLGDAGGVPRMRRDFEELVKGFPKDPNADPNSIWAREGAELYRGGRGGVWELLETGQFLVKFGDNRVFESAAKIAVTHEGSSHRQQAIEVLVQMDRWTPRAELLETHRDPEPVLLKAADSEDDLGSCTGSPATHAPWQIRGSRGGFTRK
jgi:hypothetical protein